MAPTLDLPQDPRTGPQLVPASKLSSRSWAKGETEKPREERKGQDLLWWDFWGAGETVQLRRRALLSIFSQILCKITVLLLHWLVPAVLKWESRCCAGHIMSLLVIFPAYIPPEIPWHGIPPSSFCAPTHVLRSFKPLSHLGVGHPWVL